MFKKMKVLIICLLMFLSCQKETLSSKMKSEEDLYLSSLIDVLKYNILKFSDFRDMINFKNTCKANSYIDFVNIDLKNYVFEPPLYDLFMSDSGCFEDPCIEICNIDCRFILPKCEILSLGCKFYPKVLKDLPAFLDNNGMINKEFDPIEVSKCKLEYHNQHILGCKKYKKQQGCIQPKEIRLYTEIQICDLGCIKMDKLDTLLVNNIYHIEMVDKNLNKLNIRNVYFEDMFFEKICYLLEAINTCKIKYLNIKNFKYPLNFEPKFDLKNLEQLIIYQKVEFSYGDFEDILIFLLSQKLNKLIYLDLSFYYYHFYGKYTLQDLYNKLEELPNLVNAKMRIRAKQKIDIFNVFKGKKYKIYMSIIK